MRFDAYTATTTEATVSDVMSASAGVFSLFTDMKLRQGKGFHQFGERLAVMDTLAQVGGNKSEAARRLGINRKTLLAKLADGK